MEDNMEEILVSKHQVFFDYQHKYDISTKISQSGLLLLSLLL